MTTWQKYVITIVPAIIALFVLLWVWQQQAVIPASDGGMRACTQEVMQCPDGSYVGRIGPKCEFAKCPGEGGVERQSMDTSNWKTYRNEEYGFEVRYPRAYFFREFPGFREILIQIGFDTQPLPSDDNGIIHISVINQSIEDYISAKKSQKNLSNFTQRSIKINGLHAIEITGDIPSLPGVEDYIGIRYVVMGHNNMVFELSTDFDQFFSAFKFFK